MSQQDIANPHDSFFKAAFGNLERSRQFFSAYLPEKLVLELELGELQLEKGSFVDEKLPPLSVVTSSGLPLRMSNKASDFYSFFQRISNFCQKAQFFLGNLVFS